MLLGGKIDVAADTGAGMPRSVRDDVADAMSGNLPVEFHDALENCYRRPSERTGK
jgi:hypothetical protein